MRAPASALAMKAARLVAVVRHQATIPLALDQTREGVPAVQADLGHSETVRVSVAGVDPHLVTPGFVQHHQVSAVASEYARGRDRRGHDRDRDQMDSIRVRESRSVRRGRFLVDRKGSRAQADIHVFAHNLSRDLRDYCEDLPVPDSRNFRN